MLKWLKWFRIMRIIKLHMKGNNIFLILLFILFLYFKKLWFQILLLINSKYQHNPKSLLMLNLLCFQIFFLVILFHHLYVIYRKYDQFSRILTYHFRLLNLFQLQLPFICRKILRWKLLIKIFINIFNNYIIFIIISISINLLPHTNPINVK